MSSTTRHRPLGILVLIALLASVPVAADTYVVDRTDDSTVGTCILGVSGDCALRGAIIKANNHAGTDIIRLGAATYTLSIAGTYEDSCQTGDLDVTGALTIVGQGPERTIIDAAGIDRVLHVLAPGNMVALDGLTIRGGNPAGVMPHHDVGAGIRVTSGALMVDTCYIVDNHVLTGEGGAISDYNASAAVGIFIVDSWIAGNSAFNCSAVYAGTELLMTQTTVSGNAALADSAVCVYGAGSTLTNVTISQNTGSDLAGVYVNAPSVSLENCTLSVDTTAGVLFAPYTNPTLANSVIHGGCGSWTTVTSLGGNLESPGNTCGLGSIDFVNVPDPMVTGLAWLGGPTPVHRPLTGSPLLDQPLAGIVFPAVDQRSLPRPQDGAGPSYAISDIGAVELAGIGEIFVETFECGFTTGWSTVVR